MVVVVVAAAVAAAVVVVVAAAVAAAVVSVHADRKQCKFNAAQTDFSLTLHLVQ